MHTARLSAQEFAAEIVRLNVDIIVVVTHARATFVMNATKTSQSCTRDAIDPLNTVLIASLAHPVGILPSAPLTAEAHDKTLVNTKRLCHAFRGLRASGKSSTPQS